MQALADVVDRLIDATWSVAPPADEYRQKVLHAAQRAVVDRMMQQASRTGVAAEVRAVLSDRLEGVAALLEAVGSPSPHQRLVAADIRRWQARIENTVPGPSLRMPAGDPIGGSSRGGGRN